MKLALWVVQLRGMEWLGPAHRAHWEQRGTLCTLPVRNGFSIILQSNNRVRRAAATISLEVAPEGASSSGSGC